MSSWSEGIPSLPGVYKITLLLDSRVYIGKSVNLKQRVYNYTGKGPNDQYIKRAIKKYGKENFKFEALEVFPNRTEFIEKLILERESFWIEIYDATNRKKGFNIVKFGTDLTGYKMSEEHKRKISIANKGKKHSPEFIARMKERKGEKHHNWGKKASQEWRGNISKANMGRKTSSLTRKLISESLKEKYKKDRSCWPKRKHSLETCEKISEAHKRPVNQLILGTKKIIASFPSVEEASIAMMGTRSGKARINACISGKQKSAYGCSWEFVNPKSTDKTFDTSLKNARLLSLQKGKSIPIAQIDILTGEVIKIWPSIKQASESVGVSSMAIYNCLKRSTHKSAGFKWEPVECLDNQPIPV